MYSSIATVAIVYIASAIIITKKTAMHGMAVILDLDLEYSYKALVCLLSVL